MKSDTERLEICMAKHQQLKKKITDLNTKILVDPGNFVMVKILPFEEYCAIMVNYPASEVNKILVFKDLSIKDIASATELDPRLNDDSPFAEFAPTDTGWEMAITFIEHLINLERKEEEEE